MHPAATAGLLSIVAISFLLLPAWSPATNSVAAEIRDLQLLGQARRTWHFPTEDFYVMTAGGRRIVGGLSGETKVNGFPVHTQPLPEVYHFSRMRVRRGLWALARETNRLSLVNWSFEGRAVDGPEPDRPMVVEHLFVTGRITSAEAARLMSGDVWESRILWMGIIENTAVGIAALGAVLSLGWLSPAWWRSRVRKRTTASGTCSACGYSMQGLTAERCPECGCAWTGPPDQAFREDPPVPP